MNGRIIWLVILSLLTLLLPMLGGCALTFGQGTLSAGAHLTYESDETGDGHIGIESEPLNRVIEFAGKAVTDD